METIKFSAGNDVTFLVPLDTEQAQIDTALKFDDIQKKEVKFYNSLREKTVIKLNELIRGNTIFVEKFDILLSISKTLTPPHDNNDSFSVNF